MQYQRFRSIAPLALAFVLAGTPLEPAEAKLYKWVDENGNVTYSERKPPDQKATEIKVRTAPVTPDQAREQIEGLKDKTDTTKKTATTRNRRRRRTRRLPSSLRKTAKSRARTGGFWKILRVFRTRTRKATPTSSTMGKLQRSSSRARSRSSFTASKRFLRPGPDAGPLISSTPSAVIPAYRLSFDFHATGRINLARENAFAAASDTETIECACPTRLPPR